MLYFCSLHARMHAHTHTPRVCVELTVYKTFKQISFQSLLLLFNERERDGQTVKGKVRDGQ